MRQVDKDAFYKALYADKRDIMPSIVNRFEHQGIGYRSEWRNKNSINSELFGVTESGSFPFTEPKYFLA